MIDLRSNKIK